MQQKLLYKVYLFFSFQTIFISYVILLRVRQMQQTISKRKQRIRSNFRQKLTINTKNLNYRTDEQSTQDSPVKKRLRKVSINLKSFNNIDLRREMSIKERFQECFEVQEKIGEGGHSVVYKCKDLKDGRNYAVKVTRKNDPQNLQSLKQQYRILASLDHQGILKGHFLFLNQKKSTCHLVCQYYDFPNLRQYFVEHRDESIDENKVGEIIKSILEAVQYLHEQKVCHRDLKPENILYDPDSGQIRIIDFEVAKMPRYIHQKLQMWTKAGTPTYRSPQLLQGSYNQLTDMWSLGIITFEMLTGKFPFKIKYEHQLYDEILNFVPDFSSSQISQMAKNFTTKLLKRDPKERMNAKQAMSHPYILSKTVSTPLSKSHKKLNSSMQIDEKHDQDQQEEGKISPKSKFYDQSNTFAFLSNFDKDIGIRFCQE